MFTHGLQGYTDDRLADGAGWVTFDVRSIRCPVTVLHGEATAWSMSSTHITPPKLSRPRNWSSSMTTAISAS
jgi:pimeloyl-ACP methyl ester carboxylesterase